MNPLDLRASDDDLRAVDPLTRVRTAMERAEAGEQRERDDEADAKREQAAARAEQQYMLDRAELARQGYLSREADAAKAEREAIREGRIAELLIELQRLAPGRFGDDACRADVLVLEHQGGAVTISRGGASSANDPERQLTRARQGAAHWRGIMARHQLREDQTWRRIENEVLATRPPRHRARIAVAVRGPPLRRAEARGGSLRVTVPCHRHGQLADFSSSPALRRDLLPALSTD